ncbi:MAG: hypothetical protein AAFP88_01530 [Bacteroidota bacterium]
MAQIRVMSWNLRTFGVHNLGADMIQRLVNILNENAVDILCIQEVQTGEDVPNQIGSEISFNPVDEMANICEALHMSDNNAGWRRAVSGVDSGSNVHMRDAYGFIWKLYPQQSRFGHNGACQTIASLGNPVILRQEPNDHFPGRRPGMIQFSVQTNSSDGFFVNIVSYHAQTPTNTFPGGAGDGINALATLKGVGGEILTYRGTQYALQPKEALPTIDTIVLGDFNYSMDSDGAGIVYGNLLKNYQACISTPNNVNKTTYSSDATNAFRLVSAYDNIFILRGHQDFIPALQFNNVSRVVDFIGDEAKSLGKVTQIRDYAKETAWYVVYNTLYKRQYATSGLSDHLPVFAEFDIVGRGVKASSVLPTINDDNNIFHAAWGEKLPDGSPNAGFCYNSRASDARQELCGRLYAYGTNKSFPNNIALINAVFFSMQEMYINDNDTYGELMRLQFFINNPFSNGSPAYPFGVNGFLELYRNYIEYILRRRFSSPKDAELVAYVSDRTFNVHYLDGGAYKCESLNPGQNDSCDVFYQNGCFNRFAKS